MDSQEVIRNAVRSAGRLARRVEVVARSEQAEMRSSVSIAEDDRAAASESAADARVMLRLFGQILWIPLLRGRTLRRVQSELDQARAAAKAAAQRARTDAAQADLWAEQGARATAAAGRLAKALKAVGELGIPPLVTEQAADAMRSRLDFRAGRPADGKWARDALFGCEAVISLVRDWAKAKVEAEARRKASTAQIRAIAPPQGRSGRRIYLPIPAHLGVEAERRGARRDDEQIRGVSPWSVSLDQDLAPFRSMLPLAYRPQQTRFEFPPIPMRAAGQNLWSVFDKQTWDHVRASSYGAAGRRCVICGGRGGFVADKVMDKEERRHGVDCHEVWDWSVEDPATGVGVQKLARLLVVCVSCHATFHSGHFARVAAEKGLEAEIREHIEKRRMLINRVSQADLALELEATRESLQKLSGVDRWIVDLEHLAGQQFMSGRDVVMQERNAARLPADRIAGLAFETDAGVAYPARPAAEIYADLTAEPESDYDDSNVVRFGR